MARRRHTSRYRGRDSFESFLPTLVVLLLVGAVFRARSGGGIPVAEETKEQMVSADDAPGTKYDGIGPQVVADFFREYDERSGCPTTEIEGPRHMNSEEYRGRTYNDILITAEPAGDDGRFVSVSLEPYHDSSLLSEDMRRAFHDVLLTVDRDVTEDEFAVLWDGVLAAWNYENDILNYVYGATGHVRYSFDSYRASLGRHKVKVSSSAEVTPEAPRNQYPVGQQAD